MCKIQACIDSEERQLAYTDPEVTEQEKRNEIGHLRFYWAKEGRLCHSWQPGSKEDLNDELFKAELQSLGDELFKNQLKTVESASKWCHSNPEAEAPRFDSHNYIFKTETKHYLFFIRVWPYVGDYSYIYCYPKTQKGECANV